MPGSPFKTGGTGYATKAKLPHFGPFDLDQNLVANADQTKVFVTNGGSDTVAVFDVQEGGVLKAVKGSPFPSGGKNPVSLGLAGDRLYVVNKNDDPGRDMTKTLPNYTGFKVGKDGSLTPIPKSTLEPATPWRSPTQALIVEGKFLFDGDFGSFPLPSRLDQWGKNLGTDASSSIRALKINANGTLRQHPPLLAPDGAFDGGMDVDEDGKPDPLIFGLQVHPTKKLVYIGFVTAAKIGVYRYDDEGRLTFVRAVPNKGTLVCWMRINKAGTRAYTTNNADDTVSVYDLSDAESPTEIQTLLLKGHGHPYQLDLSTDDRFFYTVKYRMFNETPVGDGSVLNVLEVQEDGTFREVDSSPVTLPVRDDLLARPQGVLAVDDRAGNRADDGGAALPAPQDYVGFMYTSTNAKPGNSIIAMGRKRDGSLAELPNSPYATGGNGTAEGEFDTQWSLRMVGDYLLAVNAENKPANGSVSVFRVNRDDGSLAQVDQDPATPAMDNMDSRGMRAASITSSSAGGKTWVVVANMHSYPTYQGVPPKAVGTVESSPLRNLAVFTMDPATGVLTFDRVGATYEDGIYGGPTTAEFNPGGTKLAVSTLGLTHFMVAKPDAALQKPSHLYVYDFADGNMTQTGMFEEVGISGSIGPSWSPDGKFIYLTNFNVQSSKDDNDLTVHDGTTGAKVQNFATGGANDEACWTLVSLDKQKLYVASFGQNVVSVFDINAENRISRSLKPNFFTRRDVPAYDTKDMYETPGGHLYVLGAYQSHSVSVFNRAADGVLAEQSGSPYRVPSSTGKTKEQHAFIGLVGIEKRP